MIATTIKVLNVATCVLVVGGLVGLGYFVLGVRRDRDV